MLDVRKLITLRAIASEGSIAAAGRALRYTRPAVSQQLTALENEAGTALVNRAGNRVTLTPAGRNLVEHAERILAELRAAEAMLSSDAAGITGLLRIGVPFHEGPRIMSRALTLGDDDFKQANLLVQHGQTNEAVAAFARLREEYPGTWIDRRSQEQLALLSPTPSPKGSPARGLAAHRNVQSGRGGQIGRHHLMLFRPVMHRIQHIVSRGEPAQPCRRPHHERRARR